MGISKRGCTDKPVESVTQDSFNVAVYVDGLCNFIRTCETPMTISIQGDWGSGKTSMMNMIKEKMENDICPVWFNTWQFSQFSLGNSLVFSMMTVLLNGLGCEKESINKVLGGVLGFTKNVAIGTVDHLVGGFAADKLNEVLTPETAVDYANEVTQLKAKFQAAVNKKIEVDKKDRVVIFVDDLDRLQPAKAVELLEVLKLFLDCENCVFVLAVDYEVVTLGIKQKFGNDVSEEKGKSFFDKIIQLPFKMPVAQYDIKNYVKKTLEKMSFNSDSQVVDVYVDLIRTSIGFNPRSMKRLFNTYQLLDIISKSSIAGMEDTVRQKVLFAVICMQMQYEGLYKYFASAPSALDNEEMNLYLDTDAVSKIMEDMDFAVQITDDAEDVEGKLKGIVAFMKNFLKAIQLDNDTEISEEERMTLRSILKCSMVTSVSDAQEVQEDGVERQNRWENRQLAKTVCNLLESEFGEFRTWLPRKARPEEGIKLSDACCYQVLEAEAGLNFSLEFYISKVDSQILSVSILLRDKSSQKDKFNELFGDSPLECYPKGKVLSWGGVDYSDILKLPCGGGNNAELIAAEWRRAYEAIKKYLR